MLRFRVKLSHDHSRKVTDERFNTVSHMAAGMLSTLAGAFLIVKVLSLPHDWINVLAVSIYALSVFLLFLFSTLHHGIVGSRRVMKTLRTLDYSAVFFVIAGTVTPLCLLTPRSNENYAALIVIWILAAGGIALRASLHNLPNTSPAPCISPLAGYRLYF